MQVELHIQPGPISDYDRLVDYARRAVKLEHPALLKILDVGVLRDRESRADHAGNGRSPCGPASEDTGRP